MKIRSLGAVILALSLFGCDHLRGSKDASAETQEKEKLTASAPKSTMPSSGRYGGDAGQPQ